MIVDKTREYQKERKLKCNKTVEKITIIKEIKDQLASADKQFHALKAKLERYCLPSFGDRKRKLAEIQSAKCELKLTILQIENKITEINTVISNKNIARQIKEYLYNKLKKLLIFYRNAEENFMKKINDVKLFDNLDNYSYIEQQNCEMNEVLQLKKTNDVEQTKQSIFFLTTMLMDIKMLISSNTQKIDRIEAYFNETQENIKATNFELEKIPKKHNRIKNKVIYFLCLSVMILTCLSIIKAVKQRKYK